MPDRETLERWQREHAEEKVRTRVDPDKVQYWMFNRTPTAFWLDPTRQRITTAGERDTEDPTRVWTHVPIHDPAWRIT